MKKEAFMMMIFLYPSVLNWTDAAVGTFPQESYVPFFSAEQPDQISLFNNTFGDSDFNSTIFFNATPVMDNIRSKVGIQIPVKSSDLTAEAWSIEQGHNTVLTSSNGTKNISDDVTNSTNQLNNQNIASLNSSRNVSLDVSPLLNATFNNFLPILDDRVIPVIVDIFFLAEVVQGMSSVLNSLRRRESEAGIQREINATKIINSRNGIEALNNLLVNLQAYYILDEVLDRNLNCGENLMRLMAQLGGNVCRGVTGRVRAMYELFTTGDTQCKDGLNESNGLGPEWDESVEGLNTITRNFGSEFEGMRNFVQRMAKRNGADETKRRN